LEAVLDVLSDRYPYEEFGMLRPRVVRDRELRDAIGDRLVLTPPEGLVGPGWRRAPGQRGRLMVSRRSPPDAIVQCV
jgi:hypothetical protein